jgi:hypothetical protein
MKPYGLYSKLYCISNRQVQDTHLPFLDLAHVLWYDSYKLGRSERRKGRLNIITSIQCIIIKELTNRKVPGTDHIRDGILKPVKTCISKKTLYPLCPLLALDLDSCEPLKSYLSIKKGTHTTQTTSDPLV